MTTLEQGPWTGEFILSEGDEPISRDGIVLLPTTVALKPGQVLGRVTSALTATAAAFGTATGTGAMGAITVNSTATQVGAYALVYTDATHFTVTAPNGATATGVNGTAFSALGIGFTMTTGGTPMVAGDGFTITVTGAVGKPTAASVANGGNTGNSTSSAVTTTGYAAKAGRYILTVIEPGTNTGTFDVEDPDGVSVGHGVVATAFSGGGLSFTLADATDFVSGDQIAITVAAGSGKWTAYNPGAGDGSNVAAGILYAAAPISTVDQKATAVVRICEVSRVGLFGLDAAAETELAKSMIIVRDL